MKKIGIVTFHEPNNYGANLQAYALQKFIEELGYDAKIIDYRNKTISNTNKLIKIKSGIGNLIKSMMLLPKNIARRKNFESFKKRNYILTKAYNNKAELEQDKNDFDVFISGSDQIWNTKITKTIDDIYTLNFNSGDARKISYASSIGNGDITNGETKELAKRIEKYENIAVREESAKELLNKYIDKKIKVVVDPTLLLNSKQWEKIKRDTKIKEEYILLYTIIENNKLFEIANKLSDLTGLKIVTLRRTNLKTKNVLKNMYTSGPDQFIDLFKNATYVVTSSFHGTVFSIIFNKKFFVNYGGAENKRVDNILNICNLQERLIKSEEQLNTNIINSQINYENVNRILEEERNKSREYLIDALEGAKNETKNK